MSERNICRQNQKHDSPHVSILFSLVVTLLVAIFKFSDLLQIANAFSALVQVSIIFAALQLRRSLPYMPRPAKGESSERTEAILTLEGHCCGKLIPMLRTFVDAVPGGMPLVFVISMLPLAVLCYVVVETCRQPFTAALCGGLTLFGFLFSLRKLCSRRRPSVGCFRTKMSQYY